jgi:hypothetical protein
MTWKPELPDMIKSVAREIALRVRVYPKWVANGRMNQEIANREILCMEAVIAILRDFHASRSDESKQ